MRSDRSPGTLGRYYLGECLATGGMAQVFAARSIEPGLVDRPIVIKQMLPQLATNRHFVSLFVQEARLSSMLDHPNIVRVLDFEASDGGLFLVMEYVDGPDLLDLLRSAAGHGVRVPPPIAAYICSHVLEALDYAHNLEVKGRSLHIIHRDISPSNVLVSTRGHVKLADFGIARAADRQDSTATGTLRGKYGYMSPEQITGSALDGRSDLFSLGVVLAELLTGRRLFSAATDLELLMMVKGASLDRLDRYGRHIPPGLRDILDRALARDPANRFATAAAFRDALIEWMLESSSRTGARQLATMIDALGLARSASRPRDRDQTLSGPNTRTERRAAASSAAIGRQIYATGGSAITSPSSLRLEDLSLTPVSIDRATETPEPEKLPALARLCEIVGRSATGALTAVRGDDCKRVYFIGGRPDFVQSNIHRERFGEFLVGQGVIRRAELTRALAASPQFGGRLAETLVGLGLLRPIDAIAWLERQTRYRLIDLAGWTSGHFCWDEDAVAELPKLPLDLSGPGVLASFVPHYPRQPLRSWACERARRSPRLIDHPHLAIAAFGFDPTLVDLLERLDGSRPLYLVANDIDDRAARYALVATLAILERVGLLVT